MEDNNLLDLDPENEAIIDKLSSVYRVAKEKNEIANMVRRKINESPLIATQPKVEHKFALLPKRTVLGYAAAAMISVFAISSVFYISNDNPVTQKPIAISNSITKVNDKQDASKYSKEYIKSENLLVYQF